MNRINKSQHYLAHISYITQVSPSYDVQCPTTPISPPTIFAVHYDLRVANVTFLNECKSYNLECYRTVIAHIHT